MLPPTKSLSPKLQPMSCEQGAATWPKVKHSMEEQSYKAGRHFSMKHKIGLKNRLDHQQKGAGCSGDPGKPVACNLSCFGYKISDLHHYNSFLHLLVSSHDQGGWSCSLVSGGCGFHPGFSSQYIS